MKMKARPQLFIDTKPLEDEKLADKIFEETDRYSITPTTFKARSFFTSSTDALFVEHYEYKGNSTIRFGINICDESFRQQLMIELITHLTQRHYFYANLSVHS